MRTKACSAQNMAYDHNFSLFIFHFSLKRGYRGNATAPFKCSYAANAVCVIIRPQGVIMFGASRIIMRKRSLRYHSPHVKALLCKGSCQLKRAPAKRLEQTICGKRRSRQTGQVDKHFYRRTGLSCDDALTEGLSI